MTRKPMSGVLSPVLTPFNADLSVDAPRFLAQCRWLLSQDVQLAIFGTNSEATSLTVAEKTELLDSVIAGGIPPETLMPGTGSCTLADTVALSRAVVGHGCGGALMLPPFYYKGVSDDGLFAYFSEVIERVGDGDLRVYLYHIPPVSQVPLSHDLIERLIRAYPGVIAGIKDSSGDWANTQGMLDRQWEDFAVFAGSETFLLQNMRAGGAGCISATANVNPAAISRLYAGWQAPDAEAQQAQLDRVRAVFQKHAMIPAMKAAVAAGSGHADWRVLRPPLMALEDAQSAALLADLETVGFDVTRLAPQG